MNGLEVVMGQLSIDFASSREPLMAIDQVAERLGVTVRHVRRLVDERRIPYLKWGKLLRFDPAEIESWLDEARRRPA
jgi:excisionase family DNA binding protein